MDRVWFEMGIGTGFCRLEMGRPNVADAPWLVRAAPYPSHIWTEYEGCQTTETYQLVLRGPIRWRFWIRAVSGLSAQMFRGKRGPVVDA